MDNDIIVRPINVPVLLPFDFFVFADLVLLFAVVCFAQGKFICIVSTHEKSLNGYA